MCGRAHALSLAVVFLARPIVMKFITVTSENQGISQNIARFQSSYLSVNFNFQEKALIHVLDTLVLLSWNMAWK